MKKCITPIACLLVLFLIGHFAMLVWETAVNLPIWDDFDSALFFVNRYLETSSISDRTALILEQHNEHRIIINRLLTLASLAIFSTVNFTFLIYCAVACLLALTILLAKGTREPWLILVLTCAIMLQPQLGDGLNWVTTCLASFALCLLALVCSRMAFAEGRTFYSVFPLMALAGFSQGNGILLPFCIAFVLFIHRNWKRGFGILSGGAIIIALYFRGYQFPAQSRKLSELIENLPAVLEYGFSLVGNAAGFSDPIASLVAGIAVSVIFALMLFSSAARKHPALVSLALFLFLSAAINTAARGLSGVQYALSPGRYTILCSGILAVLAVLLFENTRSSAVKSLLLVSALLFNYYSWIGYRSVVEEHNIRAINDLALYLLERKGLTYPWPDRGVPIFEKSLANGTFNLEEVIDGLQLAEKSTLPNLPFSAQKKELRVHLDRVQMGESHIVIEGWGFFRNCASADTNTYIRLFNASGDVVIQPRQKLRGDLLGLFNNPDRRLAGYISMFPKSYLRGAEPYQVEILYSCGERSGRQQTPYSVSTTGVRKSESGASKRVN